MINEIRLSPSISFNVVPSAHPNLKVQPRRLLDGLQVPTSDIVLDISLVFLTKHFKINISKIKSMILFLNQVPFQSCSSREWDHINLGCYPEIFVTSLLPAGKPLRPQWFPTAFRVKKSIQNMVYSGAGIYLPPSLIPPQPDPTLCSSFPISLCSTTLGHHSSPISDSVSTPLSLPLGLSPCSAWNTFPFLLPNEYQLISSISV